MLSLGTAAIGRPQYINIRQNNTLDDFDLKSFKEKGIKMLDFAYKHGISHFDTAPGYGIAETILSEWIKLRSPKNISISTKWGYTYVANFNPNAPVHEVKEHSLGKLLEQWEESKKFGAPLTIYQIHSATLESGVLENKEIHEKLAEIKHTHNIEIGFTTSGNNQTEIIKKALKIKVNNKQLFSSIQATYNIFDQSLAEEIDILKNKKVIVKEALANGRVFPNKNYTHYNEAYHTLKRLSLKYNVGIDAIALRFCSDTINPYTILSGASEPQHLISNLEVLNFQLTSSEIEELKRLSVHPNKYWEERKKLTWN